jgi:7-cyano-7-deazaguanine reductase
VLCHVVAPSLVTLGSTSTEGYPQRPITNQPDWATISYVPAGRIVESKSVKVYLETFREEGIFHEHLATTIRDDFVGALDPRSLEVTVDFNSRGGIAISAQSSYDRDARSR